MAIILLNESISGVLTMFFKSLKSSFIDNLFSLIKALAKGVILVFCWDLISLIFVLVLFVFSSDNYILSNVFGPKEIVPYEVVNKYFQFPIMILWRQ